MSDDRIRDRRVQYETDGLERDQLDDDPMTQWHAWHSDAFEAGLAEPNTMVLSTVDVHGHPDARVVLIRSADRHGFTFFTNYESGKSHQMTARPVAAATFAWLAQHRQVRVRGGVERVSDPRATSTSPPDRGRVRSVPGRLPSPRSCETATVDGAGDRLRPAVPRWSRASSAPLGWVAARARRVGVLAGSAQSAPRSVPISTP